MILDIADFEDGQTVSARFVVVGTGIGGTEVARQLWRAGEDVLLVESGRAVFDPAVQALNDVDFLAKPHRDLDSDASYHRYLPAGLRGVSRVRQFGGTSNVWTGKWKWLQENDFPGRDWVPYSAWPITLADLAPHYRAAADDYGFGDLEREALRSEIVALKGEIARHELKATSFYWEQSPTRTAERFGEEIAKAPNLRVVLGATVTELRLDPECRRVTRLSCRSLDGRRITIEADTVVLAAGALETARLLLASDRDVAGGIGNAHDLVGRFYTDHPKHHSGILHPGPLTRAHARELQYHPKPRYCLCFALDDTVQRDHQLLEHVLYLKPLYARRWQRLNGWLRGRRPCRDANGLVDVYRVKFVCEQVPSLESRVFLGEQPDALGVRRLQVDWRFTELDRHSMERTVALITSALERAGIGHIDFGNQPPTLENTTDAAHQMGTTRMATDPATGVVDPNCRVFGTDNLYVASSAVFPTGPSYSPTFTILALAHRLGRHLLATRTSGSVIAGVDDPAASGSRRRASPISG